MSRATDRMLAPSERQRLLEAMAELCAERGYGETSVEAIVERAGVKRRRFEKFFDGVEDCVVAADNAIFSQILAEVSGAYSADLPEWDSGMLGIKAILEMMAANPSSAYLGFVGVRQMGPPKVFEVYRSGIQMLTMMVERLWEHSELEVQPRSAARAALGACEAVVRAEIVAGRCHRLPELLPDLLYAATVPFLGQEQALALARRGRELLRGGPWS
jgi:AcrR family transcriptional regulator